ncbi:MAG: PRC-barrel domain-containing protein [Archaeoglobaceae archaeon]|nr:PRC-barrel domain-containing protein [Archaeoglobaceae archaeon]MDW8127919.1 PRC-barrel domain-containing protein [Archaeoglobaceae archaeon]
MAMSGEITTFFGMRVYTDEGRYVGKIEDVIIESDSNSITGIVVVDYNKALIDKTSKGVVIPYRIVRSVGDIVLIRDIFSRRRLPISEPGEVVPSEKTEGE